MQQHETVERLKLDQLKTRVKLKLYDYPIILLSVVQQSFRRWEAGQLEQVIVELKQEGFLTVLDTNGCKRLTRLVS
jgi:hypothetical protein